MSTPQSSTHIHQARLLQARTQLLERIAAQRGGARSRVDMAAEHDLRAWDAHAQASTELNEEFALNEHETAELVAIDAALARLAAGQYGQCADCGATLAPARLEAYPMALRCVACQTRTEKHR